MPQLHSDTRVVVAMDHSVNWGVYDGFEDPAETVHRVLEAGPDGVLAGVPFLRHFSDVLDEYSDVDRIGSLDLIHDSTIPGIREDAEIHAQAFSTTEASRIGADAVKVFLIYGRQQESVLQENIEFVARTAEQCHAAGLPLVVEPTLWGKRIDDEHDPDRLADAARLGFEFGADVIKIHYPDPGHEIESIVNTVPVPVYIAGGPATDSNQEFLEMVATASSSGAQGVMFGRNIWQRENPAGVIDAINAVIDGQKPIEQAATLF